MPKYVAVYDGDGEGCDDTIACYVSYAVFNTWRNEEQNC